MKEIDNILIKQVERNKTPSVQYIIFNTDSIIHRFQFGLADIKNKINGICRAGSLDFNAQSFC